MNAAIDAIAGRRSVRAYKKDPIPSDIIEMIIEAGNQAPCTYPFQPWRFVVAEDPQFREKLIQTTYPIWKQAMEGLRQSPEMLEYMDKADALYDAMDEPKDLVYYNAPVVLFVIGPENNTVDCAMACENIMIAATSLGLGSCYVGFGSMVTGNPEIVEELELKDDERIFGPILLGYTKDLPEEKALRGEKRDPEVKWI
jgi:nitroreductase